MLILELFGVEGAVPLNNFSFPHVKKEDRRPCNGVVIRHRVPTGVGLGILLTIHTEINKMRPCVC